MKSVNKCLSSILFSSAILLGLTTVSVSANSNQNNANANRQAHRVTAVQTTNQSVNADHSQRPANNYYNRRQHGAQRLYQTHYRFTKRPGMRHGHQISGLYNKKISYSRVAKTQRGNFVKTDHGWLNQKAFNQYLIIENRINYRMQVIHNANLYNLPAHTNNARKITTTKRLGLLHKWVHANAVADTNVPKGYYRFNYQGQNYWIPGQDLMFNLKSLRGHNHRLERIISYGEKMIGHSKYNEVTQHYDCASFMHHIFAHGGIHIAYDGTYNQVQDGRPVSLKHLKRGDLVFFNTYYSTDAYNHKISGHMAHVAMYIGNGLILHDTPDDADGGVDVSSLRDHMWNSHSKSPFVHKLNGFARRII